MLTPRPRHFLLFLVLLPLLFATVSTAGQPVFVFKPAEGAFEDVKFLVEEAIVGRGLKIEHRGNLKTMLERTGAAVGSTKKMYKGAMYITFCSAKYSRAAMEADPKNMVFCPYTIYLYETITNPGTTYVGYRPLHWPGSAASNRALADVNKLLQSIVDEATE